MIMRQPTSKVDSLPYSSYRFTFDHVYGIESTQREVYEISAKSAVKSALQGYNATIMAYGQTGTGKTYTMEGTRHGDERGIIPRAIEDMFTYIENDMSTSNQKKYLTRWSGRRTCRYTTRSSRICSSRNGPTW